MHLIAAAVTPGQRRAVFGGDGDLDEGGTRAAIALRRAVPRTTTWVCAPSAAARQTAWALGAEPVEEPALADPDYGTWTGHALDEVDLGAWLTDPHHASHGGESMAAVRARTGAWLESRAGETLTAVAHAAVVRAALAHALDLGPGGIWQLDVAPLSVTRLSHRAGRWHLHLGRLRPEK